MYSLEKPILENPFHPLDLSPEDLLRIYNRFQQSRQINKNPQQQLSIDTISQLISSLKGIKPSYIQKCISQSFIKPTISWNDFLTLLDQQSEIRQKILDWVLFYDQASIKKYKLSKYQPFRKIEKSYQFVTFMKLTSIGEEKFCIVEIDHEKIFLIDVSENGFKEIDRFTKKNSKTNLELYAQSLIKNNNSKIPNISEVFPPYFQSKKSNNITKSMKYQSQKLISQNSIAQTGCNIRSSELTSEDDDAYYKKQRKNIHSVFNIFANLPIEESVKLVNVTANKISDKTFNSGVASSIRDAFADRVVIKKQKIQEVNSKDIAPFERAQRKLKSLYEQKSHLSYNPHKPKRFHLPVSGELPSQVNQTSFQSEKKLTHERKQKSYILESVAISFNPEISCLAIAYHNLEILILKVGRDLNRIGFEEQDLIKITLERDHKKNQVIESVKFYHHTIRNKWFLLILIRVEYKNDGKKGKNVAGQSYILGYEVKIQDNKRKTGKSFKFTCNNDQSLIKKQSFLLRMQKFEAIILEVQPRIGIHLVSFTGKYLLYRQDYVQNLSNPFLTQYWRLGNQEKFKNSNLSLCCFSIGSKINKVLFGTNNGNIALYDTFSHNFKIKRISSHPIVKVQIAENEGYALTSDQKIILLNLMKIQEIDTFSTVNEDKLHEKVLNFEFQQKTKEIWTFGSQIKIYNQETDESELHKKRQMEKTYTWRLTKLKGQKQPNNSLKERIETKLKSQKEIKSKIQPELKSSELVISSQNYFILLSQILEIIVIEKSTMKVKFTFILNVPHDSKVMKIAISSTQKLLGVLLFNQSIYVYNIYTQELCLFLKSTPTQKFVSIAFLDPKNEYMLVSGTESGKIALIPFSTVPQKPISFLKYHKNSVNIVEVKNNFLISCCQGGKIGIWQLPFNVIKHEFVIPSQSRYILKLIGFYANKILYMKSIDDEIFEVNLSSVKLNKFLFKDQNLDPQSTNVISIDSVTNQLFFLKKNILKTFTKNMESNQWVMKNKVKIYEEKGKDKDSATYGEPIKVGIVESEKAVLFYEGGAFVFNYQRQNIGKFITFNQ